jgi:hypothetical protein
MLSAMLFGLGQCLVTAAVATQTVLVITNACKAARDIRALLWWDHQLQEIPAFKREVTKC